MPRFRDIPQFPRCCYRVDVGWDFLEDHLLRQINDINLNLDPDFQRAHVWTEAQQIAYVEYILRGGTSGKELYFNHQGWMKSFDGDYVIVDGKQRLQAARRFMKGEIPAFGYLRTEFTDSTDIFTASFSWNIASLPTRADVLEWYLNFNSAGTIHTPEELDRVRNLLAAERSIT